MPQARRALVAGATGLVGRLLLDELFACVAYDRVTALTRSPLGASHPKLAVVLVDFSRLADAGSALAADDVFCCLGTTMRRAGSREAFRQVDVGHVVALARTAHELGARRFLLVSAMSASPRSPFFYGRVKAEAEREVKRIGYERLVIVRPALLLGRREERRPAEAAAQAAVRILSVVLPRAVRDRLATPAADVARALVRLALEKGDGVRVVPAREIPRLGA